MTAPITLTATATDSVGASTQATATLPVTTGTGVRTLRRGLMTDRATWGSLLFPTFQPQVSTEYLGRELGVQFTLMWACTLEKVRIYKHPDAAGDVPVTLWNPATQTVIATTTVTWVVDSGGWVDIPLVAALSANTAYAVTYYPPNLKAYEVAWRYHGQDYVEPPFVVKKLDETTNPTTEGSVYSTAGHAFPDRHSAHYWMVDPVVTWTTTYPGYDSGTDYWQQWDNGQLSHGFPIGVFWPDAPTLTDYMSVGVNLAVALPITDAGYREAIEASGMDVYANVVESADAARYTLTDEVFAAHVRGYFLVDEPDMAGTGKLPGELVQRMQEVRSLDSTRPIYAQLGLWPARGQAYAWFPTGATPQQVAANWDAYAAMSDVLSCDWYNIANTEGIFGIWTYPLQIRRMRSLCKGNVPVWGYVETGSLGGGPNPTPAQVHSAVWACIIGGAKGVVFFDHQFAGPGVPQDFAFLLHNALMRTMVTALTAQIQSLSAALFAPEADLVDSYTTSNVTAGPYGGVHGVPIEYTTREAGGLQYLFAMSARPGATTAAFTIPTATGQTVTVIGESRTITPGPGGVVTDDFAGDYTVHLYSWAPGTPDTTSPAAPTNLVTSAVTATGFTLGWDAATDDSGTPPTYQARVNGGAVTNVTGLSHAFTGLAAATQYTAEVRARDAAGNVSAWVAADPVTTSDAPLPTPAAAWGFAETTGTVATDSSGHGHDLTVTAAMLGNPGHTGTGLRQVNGVTVSTPSTWITGTERTIMFWARKTATNQGFARGVVLEDDSSNTPFGVFVETISPEIQFRAYSNVDAYLVTSPVTPIGEWHHYCCTVIGGKLRAYLDGVQVGSDVTVAGTLSAHTKLTLNNAAFIGLDLDDVRVLNAGVTTAEVVRFMNAPV